MSRQSMSCRLHPSLIAVVALLLSGCAGVLGVSALGTGVPVRVEMAAQADATAPASGEAAVAVSTGEARTNVRVETRDVRGDANVATLWQTPAEPAPLPDPFAVAAAMLGGGAEVQVASVGAASASIDPRAEGSATTTGDVRIDSRVENRSRARSNGGARVDARLEGRGGADYENSGSREAGGPAPRRSSGVDARVERPGATHGNARTDARVETDADAELNVDARVEFEARRQARARVEVEATARGRRLGGGAGVRGREGRTARLGALTEGGLVVDGVLTDFAELAPLASVGAQGGGAEVSLGARIDTGAELDVSATLEHARLPAAGGETHLVVHVRGAETADTSSAQVRARVRVRLVIDRSSSMQASWSQVMGAARNLIAQLSPDDELQIVAYGTRAVEALPTSRVGDGSRARRALGAIRVGGGTNIEAGLRLAYDAGTTAGDDRLTLVVLVSDGVPNGGAFTADELAPMAARAKLQQGCRTTVVGFGDEFDPDALRAIASAGGGAYRVAPDAAELAAVLEAEVGAMTRVRARDVKVRVALPAGVRLTEAAGDARITASGEVELSIPALTAGEERSLILGVRVRAGSGATAVAQVSVSYRVGATQRRGEKTVRVARGDARLDVNAARALADADLGLALDMAARAVNNGEARDAAEALRAHAGRIEARATLDVRLSARARATRRVASALERLVPSASWPERRQTSLALGALSARFGG